MSTHAIDISSFEQDPRLFLFTSLTAGSSHIITATSRMETILKANKIPFQAIDLATDEKARRLWQRRAKERKLPGLVREGWVLGDLEEVEEWNEFGELKENVGSDAVAAHKVTSGVNIAPPIPVNPTATQGTSNISPPAVATTSTTNKAPQPNVDESKFRALPGAAEIAERAKAKKAAEEAEKEGKKSVIDENVPPAEGMTSAPREKEESLTAATAATKLVQEEKRTGEEHLSAPPSAFASGVATPNPEPEGTGDTAGEKEKETLASPEGVGATKNDEETLTHRGSEVKEAPVEQVKRIESENSLAEAAEEEKEEALSSETAPAAASTGKAEDEVAEKAAAVEASDAGEGKAAEEVKEQGAKADGDAGKSVGD